MRYLWVGALLALVAVGAIAYRTSAPPSEAVPQVALFGGVPLRLEFATSTAARERGLSGRTSIPADYGMLFVFKNADRHGFWMKDTLVPLDIFWLDDKGQVVHVAADVQPSSYPNVFYPTVPARYVLETAAGFASEHRIATGTPLILPTWPSVLE